MGWIAFDGGKSLGTRGSENGTIQRDEEHDLGARITLEEGGATAPWSITCGIYGWMFHTRFFKTEADGEGSYDQMKDELEGVLRIIPTKDEDSPERIAAVSTAIERFVERFP